jgi:hypothetical protein
MTVPAQHLARAQIGFQVGKSARLNGVTWTSTLLVQSLQDMSGTDAPSGSVPSCTLLTTMSKRPRTIHVRRPSGGDALAVPCSAFEANQRTGCSFGALQSVDVGTSDSLTCEPLGRPIPPADVVQYSDKE